MIDQTRAHKSVSSHSTTKLVGCGKWKVSHNFSLPSKACSGFGGYIFGNRYLIVRRRTYSGKGLGLRTPRAARPSQTRPHQVTYEAVASSNADICNKRAQVVTNLLIYHRNRIYWAIRSCAFNCYIHRFVHDMVVGCGAGGHLNWTSSGHLCDCSNADKELVT